LDKINRYNQIWVTDVIIVDQDGDAFAVNKMHLKSFFSTKYDSIKRGLRRLNKNKNEDGCKKSSIERRKEREKKQVDTLNGEQWTFILNQFNHSCAYCGDRRYTLTQDHFIPLINGGGRTLQNIIPACLICNSSKNKKDFFKWYRSNENYCYKRENKILSHLYSMETHPNPI
jgi:5-methylcytosine-specific restriction endonuclease McrA